MIPRYMRIIPVIPSQLVPRQARNARCKGKSIIVVNSTGMPNMAAMLKSSKLMSSVLMKKLPVTPSVSPTITA